MGAQWETVQDIVLKKTQDIVVQNGCCCRQLTRQSPLKGLRGKRRLSRVVLCKLRVDSILSVAFIPLYARSVFEILLLITAECRLKHNVTTRQREMPLVMICTCAYGKSMSVEKNRWILILDYFQHFKIKVKSLRRVAPTRWFSRSRIVRGPTQLSLVLIKEPSCVLERFICCTRVLHPATTRTST